MMIGTGRAPIHKLEDWRGKSIRTNFAKIDTAPGATVKDVPVEIKSHLYYRTFGAHRRQKHTEAYFREI
jgi:hypothetical protein